MMFKPSRLIFTVLFALAAATHGQEPPPPSAAQTTPQAAMAVDEWTDEFDGKALNEEKWERFTMEGGGGGKVEVDGGQLRMNGMGGSRTGVRSKPTFMGDRFIVEATIARVAAGVPEPGQSGTPQGNAILTILFDGSGRNRIEWLLTSEGRFEAWSVVEGKGERLDNRNLGTKEEKPTLAVVRRGDEYLFMLNGEVGLQKSVKNMPRGFRVMLYGYGSSVNNWESVRVVVPKKK
ncbi:MAG TPA: hypothetical protein VE842_10330 [Pyrinomonadaceae bacterium]|nr:hypothetical protein [Pyrinomonadaceae bacterium]